jgi:hypothetical protein
MSALISSLLLFCFIVGMTIGLYIASDNDDYEKDEGDEHEQY